MSNAITTEEYADFRSFLHKVAGIDLGDSKQYLVATRIRRIMRDNDCENVGALNSKLKRGAETRLRQDVVDAMTTNETFWFRDNYPFDYLKSSILPSVIDSNRGSPVKVWCAACSSGQEPYSISMIFDEFIKSNLTLRNSRLDIQATDLSSNILAKAKAGEYDRLSVSRGMSDIRLRAYFEPMANEGWRVKEILKKNIRYKPINLQESFLSMGKFDIVFCRNVLIYFAPDLKQDILKRIRGVLKPGGYLFLGSSESLGAASEFFDMEHCKPGVVFRAK
ncbi:MAG: chemotaxis protein methyltransferase CheR [Flavobacteriales bacterium]|jgi:chemotaxis protein methyltransferase CheR